MIGVVTGGYHSINTRFHMICTYEHIPDQKTGFAKMYILTCELSQSYSKLSVS